MLKAEDICYEIESPDGELSLLNHVNFSVPKGHFMAIVGPSGCGKTTLLKAIAGMVDVTEGTFFWEGRDLMEDDFDPSEIGYVPQFSIAYDALSVDENIENAARLRCRFNDTEELDTIIDRSLNLTGLQEIGDRDVRVLSGGQKRRLALAMELVSDPSILICDEVTSGLDPRSEKDIVALLHDISRTDGRIVLSVTHSLANLRQYDSVLVLHEGCVAYHGTPRTICHYFGVEDPEDIYPKLQTRSGKSWTDSWSKHVEAYYKRMFLEREEKIRSGDLQTQEDKTSSTDKTSDLPKDLVSDEPADLPGFFSQFFCLFSRRFRLLFRDRGQCILQLVMILSFPLLVAMFTEKGSDPIIGMSATQTTQTFQRDIETQQMNMKTASAISGIMMFEVILLGLMGSNNAAREVAGERTIMEKEKYAGLCPMAYLTSKIAFLSTLVLIQSAWMFLFVDFFWERGGSIDHLIFLILANAAITFVCLGISSLCKSADQASLLSIYLVGFQLPLSGAVLALPTYLENIIRPCISAYWAWSGCLDSLPSDVYHAVKNVLDTELSPNLLCYFVLVLHIIFGIAVAYWGIRRPRWD